MAEELWDEIQNMDLGRADPEIFIPQSVYAEAITRNRLSLIARPLNPTVQNLHTVVSSLPRVWGLASRTHGRVLDGTFLQFLFQSEVDLLSVQRREPWVFNNWFVAFQRWEDFPDLNFLTTIDLWVQIRGIPLAYVSNATVRYIAERLGKIVEVDFNEATSTQIAFIRVRIRFGVTDSLRFFRRFSFRAGESVLIRFQYERLRRLCSICFRMTHARIHCPFLPSNRVAPAVFHRNDQVRGAEMDVLNRSNLNSQSQNSDRSFPEPMTPPPRVNAPPPNAEELAAASPYFQYSGPRNFHQVEVPIPQYESTRRMQSDIGSSVTPSSDSEVTIKIKKKFELGESSRKVDIGESSKRQRPDLSNDMDKKQKQKVQDYGGIQIPPKKR
ncbi:hypothetical protein ISN45_Aa06g013810 [Arabidopsis thaliana x Arabidopsis arenosa]|uniref:Uncharacterized protein n=1 Tax=Arabidopsis thaliana x Arabidopsis arenosa TaxID=1240361 RepID=A0A8T1YWY1_9BRAS|nr:hypothetical protein ISN45_Aa06g013810 [Arabidopsis thaliana x Arabidopsis arenosa]